MKKVTAVSMLIILCFAVAIYTTFWHRQQNPMSIDFSTATAYRADRYSSISINSEGKLNINTATIEELTTLHGIGKTLAKRIIQYRQTNGPYASINDLLNVHGIGETTLNGISSYICAE